MSHFSFEPFIQVCIFIRAVVWLYPLTAMTSSVDIFFFVRFAFMCTRGDPLDRYLMSSGGTRQCDSLGFITHEDSGISLKSSIYCTRVLSSV